MVLFGSAVSHRPGSPLSVPGFRVIRSSRPPLLPKHPRNRSKCLCSIAWCPSCVSNEERPKYPPKQYLQNAFTIHTGHTGSVEKSHQRRSLAIFPSSRITHTLRAENKGGPLPGYAKPCAAFPSSGLRTGLDGLF
jgi:hypothetical protein